MNARSHLYTCAYTYTYDISNIYTTSQHSSNKMAYYGRSRQSYLNECVQGVASVGKKLPEQCRRYCTSPSHKLFCRPQITQSTLGMPNVGRHLHFIRCCSNQVQSVVLVMLIATLWLTGRVSGHSSGASRGSLHGAASLKVKTGSFWCFTESIWRPQK